MRLSKAHNISSILFILALGVIAPLTSIATESRVGPVEVELVTEMQSIVPGQPFELGLRIVPDSNWHVYWKNPGDAGLPPKLNWTLPRDFSVSDIHYPVPSLIPAGPLAAYGYYGEVLYTVTMTPPSDLLIGDTARIILDATWLVCQEVCLPGSLTVSINLPIDNGSSSLLSRSANLFEQTRRELPQALPPGWTIRANVLKRSIELTLIPDREYTDSVRFEFFAAEKALIEYSARQVLTERAEGYLLELKRSMYSRSVPDSIAGVLTVSDGGLTENYSISIPTKEASPQFGVSTTNETSFLLAIVLAFVGGIILNLMPCVLPVLSLKILGLVEQAGKSKSSLLAHGLAFSLGIVATFWALVAVMFILQAGGEQLGWGFQLQSPGFVLVMAGFIFLLALNMFGLFEIGFLAPNVKSVSGESGSGLASAFASGLIATLLATPCTAPFMGTALGYSLTQPPIISLMIYTALGLGMASPYLLITLFPALMRLVPKPGRWIETLKQGLGFVLIATVIWLAWVLSFQTDPMALLVLHAVLMLLAIAAWIYGRWSMASNPGTAISSRIVSAVIVISSLSVGTITVGSSDSQAAADPTIALNKSVWNEFSSQKIDSLRASGQPVFVDFTAAWCLSCQVNEQVALSSDEVYARFKALDVTLFKADWTRRSPEISKALARFGRNSVPLYVLYGHGESDPIILPEILTTGIVLEALDIIDKRQVNRDI